MAMNATSSPEEYLIQENGIDRSYSIGKGIEDTNAVAKAGN
jgi:hypothetical protein